MALWTEEQKAVIAHREGNLLVSAAAGSGKTAVLVEHVLSLILEENASLSSLVLMTFTEAAAEEMKERIKKRLEEHLQKGYDKRILREIALLPTANISTIHAFCKRLIEENYAGLSIDAHFRIGDTGEMSLLQSDILEELLEEEYEKKEESFLAFVDQFSMGKKDKGIEELILKLYMLASAMPFPTAYLEGLLEEDAHSRREKWEKDLYEDMKSRLENLSLLYEDALDLCREPNGPIEYEERILEERDQCLALAYADNLEDLVRGLESLSFGRLKSTKSEGKELVKSLRERGKKTLKTWQENYRLLPKELEEEVEEKGQKRILELVRLCLLFLERYQKEKEERAVLDFSDLEHFALKLLYQDGGDGAIEGEAEIKAETEINHEIEAGKYGTKEIEMGKEKEVRYSALADDLAKSYREILVDEYQDSNLVQEYIVRALSQERFGKPNVFQVGDVKQSIYRFRMARPELFLEKYHDESYPKIFLRKNFRSDEGVLSAVNTLFFKIMKKDFGGIEYDLENSLFLGKVRIEEAKREDCSGENQGEEDKAQSCEEHRDKPEGESPITGKQRRDQTELLLLELEKTASTGEEGEEDSKEDDSIEDDGNSASNSASNSSSGKSLSKLELECKMIAGKVRELLKKGYAYKDMVILLRSPHSVSREMVDIFGKEGIPAYAELKTGYYSAVEVETVLSFLAIIDNPRQDIPMAAVLRSPLFSFTDEELGQIVLTKGSLYEKPYDKSKENAVNLSLQAEKALPPGLEEKWQNFQGKLERYRRLSRSLRLHSLLTLIYEETDYYNYVRALPLGEKRQANLDQLLEDAKQFEKGSYSGLFHFIRYIEKVKKQEQDQGEATVFSEKDDLLRIMSIHHSKGLQFKVVFLSQLHKTFNKMDSKAKMLMDAELGLAADYLDLETRIKYPSLHKIAIKEKSERESLGEELRVLYVAMTRAEEKLILTGVCKNEEDLIKKFPVQERLSLEDIRGVTSYLAWILMAYSRSFFESTKTEEIALRFLSKEDLEENEGKAMGEAISLEKKLYEFLGTGREKTEAEKLMEEHFSYVYPYEKSTHRSPKYSVSLLKMKAMEEHGEAISETGQEGKAVAPEWDEANANAEEKQQAKEKPDSPLIQKMKAEGKNIGAAIGDSYHHALAFYDYSKDISQLSDFLSPEEYGLLNQEKLQKFLDSPLGHLFAKAYKENTLYREQHFMQEVEYEKLFPEDRGDNVEKVILQGIIDAFIMEEDGIILVDYKTDRVKDGEELRNRYQKQIDLYSEALEQILGKKVKRRVLYSFSLGEEVDL
ncbi:UvrD-helicase domain-containing protein [uncultured Oribacterium sp.]|uniref:UvrD-helicase domain-containing protein n=1 Tax=uncultured Oribacterium sp. TaxID=462198 RepID=UPI002803DC75|nr:UvrD-helicase domain-containing protein [uncultured Oribacterium sp.]